MEQHEYKLMARMEESHWWFRARREILAEVMRHHLPRPSGRRLRLAEIGCGTGGNLPMLAHFGDVLGAEHDPSALAYLKEKHGDTFAVMQHTVPEPIPSPFDVLAMFDVLEHISDDVQAMEWLSRQLRPGGIAVITVPAFPFLWTESDEALHHFRRYTPETLRKVLPPSMKLVHLTCFNSMLFAPILAFRTVLRLLPFKQKGPPRTHMGITIEPFNWLLYRLFRFEKHFAPKYKSPVGVSVLMVAVKR